MIKILSDLAYLYFLITLGILFCQMFVVASIKFGGQSIEPYEWRGLLISLFFWPFLLVSHLVDDTSQRIKRM